MIYIPDGKSVAVFVYFHGGGIESGDKSDGAMKIAEYLTDRGVVFISANYRMYPKICYPEFLYDSAEAVL